MSTLAVTLPFDFQQPQWLWLCAIVPLLVVTSLRSLAGLDPVRRVAALVVRSLLVIAVAVCLARVRHVQRSDDLTVLFLMDRSYSVQEKQSVQEEFIRSVTEEMSADDRVGLIDFARNAYLQQRPLSGYHVPPGRLPIMPNTDRTDVASAMRLAMAMFPHDTTKRIVLLSDGNDNMGDVLTEARRAKADGIPIDVVPLWYRHENEVYFDRMIAPAYAEPGEQVPIRMILNSHRRATGTVDVYQNDRLVELPEKSRRVTLQPGPNTFMIKLPVREAGTQTYRAVFNPDREASDAVALNNEASAFTFVSGKRRVLIISDKPEHDRVMLEALQSENVLVQLKSASELGNFDLLRMLNYATIVLSNVPAATFTNKQLEEFAVYVREMGSGLVMLGGDQSFGAGGWIGTPVEQIMPVHFEIKHKRVIPRGALALIMHSCEIPRGNYWGKEMAKKSVDTISSRDYIGILAFRFSPGGTTWEVPLGLNTNKEAVKARIDRMQIGDMPDFGPSMRMALREMTTGTARDAAQRHVIILSDGDAQAPPAVLINDYVRNEITVSTIAIGWGAHVMTSTMTSIAKKTGGKFYQARNAKQLPQIFVKESTVVRRPLIIDEAFQPQVLHGYSALLAGVDPVSEAFPPLGGMVLSSPKESPNVLIPIVRVTDDGEDPVLAHWQHGLGKTVAFTSGYWPHWGDFWTQWPKFARFWAQVVRWSMRQESPANFDTYTRIDGSRGRIVIDALDKDASYLNNLELKANLVGPDNKAIPLTFTQRGPGNYQAEFDVETAGQYLSSVQIEDRGRYLGPVRTGLSVPFSPEFRDLVPNESLLRQVADVTGGRMLELDATTEDVFRHDLPPVEAKRPVWHWVLAWMVLPLFLVDVAVRRLASWVALSIAVEVVILVVLLWGLDLRYGWGILGAVLFAELIGWSIRFRSIGAIFEFLTHGVTALAQTGERSTASLQQLKGTRERVRDEMSEDRGERLFRLDEQDGTFEPQASRRRFDAGEPAGGEPAGDLGESLGGARRDAPPPTQTRTTRDDASEEPDATTSRLLRAKRRRRE